MPIYCRFYINFAAHFNRGREKNVTIFYHFLAAPLHVITDKITKIFYYTFSTLVIFTFYRANCTISRWFLINEFSSRFLSAPTTFMACFRPLQFGSKTPVAALPRGLARRLAIGKCRLAMHPQRRRRQRNQFVLDTKQVSFKLII